MRFTCAPSIALTAIVLRIIGCRTQARQATGAACAAQRDQHDFRGHAEAERHDAAAEAAGDDDVAVRADMAVGELRPGGEPATSRTAAPGRHGYGRRAAARRAKARALAMSGSCASRIDRRAVGDLCKRRAEIVDADARAPGGNAAPAYRRADRRARQARTGGPPW